MNKYQKAFDTITNTLICYMIRRDLYPLPSDDEIYNAQRVLLKLVEKAESFEWIPVSERLPEEYDSVFAKLYGTDKWDDTFWRTRSKRVLVTIEHESGIRSVTESYITDGKWALGKRATLSKYKVVAWMPLPNPYKEKENDIR